MRRLLPFLCALLFSHPLLAQDPDKPLSVEDVSTLLGFSMQPELRLEMIRRACVTFPLDEAAVTRLRAAGADEPFFAALKNVCFAGTELAVQSDPAGAEVLIDQAQVGTAPWSARMHSGLQVRIDARLAGRVQSTTATLLPRSRMLARFEFPSDTIPLPRLRTAEEIAGSLGIDRQWEPTEPAPAEPFHPGYYDSGVLGLAMIAGGGAGGYLYCQGAAHQCGFPDEPDFRAGAGVLGGMVVAFAVDMVVSNLVNGARDRRHERAQKAFPRLRAEWESRMAERKRMWVRSHPDVREVVTREEAEYQRARSANEATQQRNASLSPPRVISEPLQP